MKFFPNSDLWQVWEHFQKSEARVVEEKLQMFKQIGSDVKVVKLKLMDMLDLIKRCNFHPSAHKIQLEEKKDSQDENKQDFSPSSFFHSASSGIIPKTLWCGAGNIAKHFNHLGPDFQLDRCCRQHDFCPYDLPRLSTRNPTPYTQCFCKCDELFYNCLKDVGSTSADDVGKMFFNIVKMRCVDFVQPKKCSEWRDDDGCIEWEEDQESMPELVVVQPADRY
ncbi:acidic phospholipase A2 PA4 isoform X2 [Eurytemora carolleeae]|uniref:acidic phospholipase A2 PA4 isoform X2 n=1 Tax=Eurytemora carolleeae TaxID=1294199 RepID=UPI000C786D72|nr:acidic phospholipase A2 PA4 isoform X2 [Eurytemora carolleeae]|eukprot:XP_023335170.1 acidic phospholipase A2 PA4-like isoform X2 [Eurytemora affinis]